jgi:predicted extracellular nuclease
MSSCILYCVFAIIASVCNVRSEAKNIPASGQDFSCRIMFYNVENLFDIWDDSLKTDEQFTPAGDLHWTYKRYSTKLNNLSKVIISAGTWDPPDIIGLCEIENRMVLEDLTNDTPLSKFGYRIIHENSPDERGIDVAFLYNPAKIKVINYKKIVVSAGELQTRDILHIQVLILKDTCHFFINHWPSRSSGQIETEKHRIHVAGLLKVTTDSILAFNPQSRILIMGDFNDEPSDISLSEKLQALSPTGKIQNDRLYNITKIPEQGNVRGTLKYQGAWNTFDQIIVSGNLLTNKKGIRMEGGFHVLQNLFLLETDEKYNGYKPFRTYTGFSYRGGYSDHLPVYTDIITN